MARDVEYCRVRLADECTAIRIGPARPHQGLRITTQRRKFCQHARLECRVRLLGVPVQGEVSNRHQCCLPSAPSAENRLRVAPVATVQAAAL